MNVKELKKDLEQYGDDELIWFHHKLKGKIMPLTITVPVKKTELTANGVLLKG